MEFGNEQSPGKRLRESPAIVKGKNGSLRLEMAKDHTQSSIQGSTPKDGEQMMTFPYSFPRVALRTHRLIRSWQQKHISQATLVREMK